jgi:hypothetical protein
VLLLCDDCTLRDLTLTGSTASLAVQCSEVRYGMQHQGLRCLLVCSTKAFVFRCGSLADDDSMRVIVNMGDLGTACNGHRPMVMMTSIITVLLHSHHPLPPLFLTRLRFWMRSP